MKAIVFAAGLGTRLRPLTDDRPKALVEVGGRPLLDHVMRRLAEAGCDEVVVNVHHFAGKVIDYLSTHSSHGMTVHVSDESDLLLDTGGGIARARQWLDGDEPFIAHNADILTTLDLRAMVDAHRASRATATLLVKQRDTRRYLLLDNNDRLRGWTHLDTGEVRPEGIAVDAQWRRRAFGGVHVISPDIFDALEAYRNMHGPKFGIIPFYVDNCRQINVRGYEPPVDYQWLDVGKPDTLARARELFKLQLL